jgi:PAB-dependent poly(A)-specific ribonuclease subunit 2
VLSIGMRSVHLSNRLGRTLWHVWDPTMTDLRCMAFVGKGQDQLLAAGCQNTMYKIDVENGTIIETIHTDHKYTTMKAMGPICAATTRGTINLLDSMSLEITGTLNTGAQSINDMDGRGSYLVTCCWVKPAQGPPKLGTIANVWDVARKEQLNPISAQSGAAFVQLHPRMSTTGFIASRHGQVQTVDLTNPGAAQTKVSQSMIQDHVSGFALAPSGEAVALIDGGQIISLLAQPSAAPVRFSRYPSQPLELPSQPQAFDRIDVDSTVPFNTIGMPYYRDRLLSAWSSDAAYVASFSVEPVHVEPSDRIRIISGAEYYKNTKNARSSLVKKSKTEQYNETHGIGNLSLNGDKPAFEGKNTYGVPKVYEIQEITYSKFGVEDFKFQNYNNTKLSGLETHISNSYNNALLQLLRFTPMIRNFSLHHAAADCREESCLLCELGFLCDSMEKAEGRNCQATNFLRTFSNIDETKGKRILDEQNSASPLTDMLQLSSSVILEHLINRSRAIPEHDNKLEKALVLDVNTNQRCVQCNSKLDKQSKETYTTLNYHLAHQNHSSRYNHHPPPPPTFSQVLRNSIQQSLAQTRGFCTRCSRYQSMVKQRTIKHIPEVLTLHAGPKNREMVQCCMKPGWLPDRIGIVLENGRFTCFEGEDLRLHLLKGAHDLHVYDLVGVVAEVTDKENNKPHMVSLINTGLSTRTPSDNEWTLFNDFTVHKVDKQEALRFNSSWKMPSVFSFQASTLRHNIDDTWKENLNTSLLYDPMLASNNYANICEPLRPGIDELGPGFQIAIDTEFVTLHREEIEMKADGERHTVRPQRFGLGRISILRGQGVDEEVPFIDDYIKVQEEVIDYQTRYSGINPGDLDPATSPHRPISRKAAYKKIWLLSNLGCVFIGHGLVTDFRTINIQVPPSQVMDTQTLFQSQNQKRKLRLSYLVWIVLKEKVQQGNHDSIEDARAALRLWRKYKEFADAGIVELKVDEIYESGKAWNWTGPDDSIPAGAGLLGARGITGVTDGGRTTPDMFQRSSPATPAGKRLGRPEEYFESPLR